MQDFDVVIIGGGMVGAATALSLSALPLSVAMVEKHAPRAFDANADMDLRVSAINLGSEKLLQRLGVWQQILAMRGCEYKRLAVWDEPRSRVDFNAEHIKQSHLGHIVENNVIQLALWQALSETQVKVFAGCSDINIDSLGRAGNCLTIDGQTLNAKLLIGADGARSGVRDKAGIGVTGWQYQQAAMLINIDTEFEQQDITWQHFTPSGPKAFLPLPGQRGSLVWYDDIHQIKKMAKFSPEQLHAHIATTFAELPGSFRVKDFAYFPLTRQHANDYVKPGLALVGDAAHSINPLAGQGVNLGFRDVQGLYDVLATACEKGEAIDALSTLREYEQARRKDNALMMTGMDALYAGFSTELAPLKFLRNAAFSVVNRFDVARNLALKYAVGL